MHEFNISDVHEHLNLFDDLEITVWIGGGWGVDALLGEQTRVHGDLDIVIEQRDCETLRTALLERGFVEIHTGDQSAWNFVMEDQAGRQIDFHVIEIAEDGRGAYGPPENDDFFPADSLTGTGLIGGRPVICHPAASQVAFHTGYALKPKDFADVTALHERFGIPLPPEYRDT